MDRASDPGPPIEIRLLGGFDVRLHGLPLSRLRSRSEEWLLALLALRREQETDRAWLAESLWPDSEPERVLFYLRRGLTDLRRALGTQANRLATPTPRTVSLELSDAVVDVFEFDAVVATGDPESIERTALLYGGPLLPGCPHDWALHEREARQQAYLCALKRLASCAVKMGPATEQLWFWTTRQIVPSR